MHILSSLFKEQHFHVEVGGPTSFPNLDSVMRSWNYLAFWLFMISLILTYTTGALRIFKG
ncbi:hypothetical protein MtrunA17_Chr6g0478881 [Medicago truncatula]|uniref:Transmembrane protein n=1 Tax=Medicago truncatula TaxID=3880 RepID=A0A396HN52_MEDTR|nr:hypothetical protein MtrunA17_Chr6g0478881 [Medicago truncatula]